MAKISTLQDDFSTKDTGKWNWNGTADVSGGQLILYGSAAWSNSITSIASYDLADSSLSVQLAEDPINTTKAYLALDIPGGDAFEMFLNQDGNTYTNEVVSGSSSYENFATSDRWWRIRESGGVVYWDTSADGITWTNRRSKAWEVSSVASVKPALVCGDANNATQPAVFDNFNIPMVNHKTDFLIIFDR